MHIPWDFSLDALISREPAYLDAYVLLGEIYVKEGKTADAGKIYNRALSVEGTPESFRSHVMEKLDALKDNP